MKSILALAGIRFARGSCGRSGRAVRALSSGRRETRIRWGIRTGERYLPSSHLTAIIGEKIYEMESFVRLHTSFNI